MTISRPVQHISSQAGCLCEGHWQCRPWAKSSLASRFLTLLQYAANLMSTHFRCLIQRQSRHLMTIWSHIEPLHPKTEWNLGDRVLGEVGKNGFIVLPDKGSHRRLICCQDAVSQLGGDIEGLYSNGSKRRAWSACGHSFHWLVVRLSGHQHPRASGSNQPGVYMLVPSI